MPVLVILISIIIVILVIRGLLFVNRLRNTLYNAGNRQSSQNKRTTSYQDTSSRSSRQQEKEFAKDEGKYIDFEEIKEE